MQVDELGVLREVITKRISKLTDEKEIAKAKILLASVDKNKEDALSEVSEYQEVIDN